MDELTQALVLHFGEMGSRWGISRTVGQIYAFLVFSEDAKNADQIAEALGFSRSNVSIGLKELQSWELVRPQHRPGDRKEYFSVPEDVWDIARTLVRERRRREIDPTLSVLRAAMVDGSNGSPGSYTHQRVEELHDFIELIVGWTDDMQTLDASDIRRMMKLGAGISRVLDFGRRLGRADTDSPESDHSN
ncbi:MAG: GbsR/MarR family transcriptional regulator [Pseudomonadota bacterium]